MTAPFTFLMMFDDDATPMLEDVMVSSMSASFPECRFEAHKAPGALMENTVVPILGVASTDDGEGSYLRHLPTGLRATIQNAFDDYLQEARAAVPS